MCAAVSRGRAALPPRRGGDATPIRRPRPAAPAGRCSPSSAATSGSTPSGRERTASWTHGGAAAGGVRPGPAVVTRGLGWLAAFVILAAAITGCQERLTAPAECPELCPGGESRVFDTVITPLANSDTSYVGYVARTSAGALLVSNGLPASEDRAVIRFNARADSIDGARHAARLYRGLGAAVAEPGRARHAGERAQAVSLPHRPGRGRRRHVRVHQPAARSHRDHRQHRGPRQRQLRAGADRASRRRGREGGPADRERGRPGDRGRHGGRSTERRPHRRLGGRHRGDVHQLCDARRARHGIGQAARA